MKTTIEKGLNIIKGQFAVCASSNGDRIKRIIAHVNALVGTTQPKMIIPVSYGIQSIIHHIENDDEALYIINIDVNEGGISKKAESILISLAEYLKTNPTDKMVVICFDIRETPDDEYGFIEQIVEAYGSPCIIIENKDSE